MEASAVNIQEMADRLGVVICVGGCGLSASRHRAGVIDPFGIIHFAERRFTKRGAKNLLMLVARRAREMDPGYLNIALYDWWYVYSDSVVAFRLARGDLGIRLPAHLFDRERARCRDLAARRNVRLSKYRRVYEWSRS